MNEPNLPGNPSDVPGDLPKMFFERLAGDLGDLVYALSELGERIERRNLQGVFDVLGSVECRLKGMQKIAIVFDGYLDNRQRLITSLNPGPKEGL